MKQAKTILLLYFFLVAFHISAQQDPATQKMLGFIKNIKNYNILYPQEKVYLHFDNTGYYLGETIWFKAYSVTTKFIEPTIYSKILYVELITPEGDIIETKKLKIEEGQCHGEFLLRDSMFAGFYEVRAYTRSMLNFGNDCIFSRVFPIYNKPKNPGQYSVKKMQERPRSQMVPIKREKAPNLDKINLSFYPESGKLVKGICSKIAFKATDKNGKNIDLTGTVVDDQGDEVATLNTTHMGMGHFFHLPIEGKYTAKIKFRDKEESFVLPIAASTGYVMSINNLKPDVMQIQIQKSPDLPIDTIGLSVTCRGNIYCFESIITENSEGLLFNIPKEYLPSGVIQITLFDKKGEILAERLSFVNHHNELSIKATFDKVQYLPYDSINLSLEVKDKSESPIETSVSLSVYDRESVTGINNTGNILTNMLLSSDLKGHIENPSYYFESDDKKHQENLDLLMLTQGWSMYSWKKMTGIDSMIIKQPEEPGLVIDGKVLSIFRKKPKENTIVTMWMITSDSLSQRDIYKTGKDGKFVFLLRDFQGTADLSLQTNEKEKRKENRIIIDRAFSPTPKPYSYTDTEIIEQEITEKENTILQTKKKPVEDIPASETIVKEKGVMSRLLPEVIINDKKKYNRESEGLNFANIVYDVAKEVDLRIDKGEDSYSGILEFLEITNPYFSYPAGGFLKRDGRITMFLNTGNTTYISPDSSYTYKGGKVIFVINNSLIVDDYTNQELPFTLYLDQIKTITISENPILWNRYCPNLKSDLKHTVIYIYTYGDIYSREDPYGVRKTRLQGYSNIKEFFSPVYRGITLPDEVDVRRTLYWNPDVKTDSTGKATVIFYNNRSCKSMNISAETITKNGIPGVLLENR